MSCIVFETPGHIDLRAFTLMGVSAKPNTANPIGMFGTGLKYAMATMVRLGAQPIVFIGEDKYTFFKRGDKFRDADFEKLSMRRESFRLTKPRVTDLSYAVSYGRNWKPWMCFRELETNTIDEGGRSWHDTAPVERIVGKEGVTRIIIDHSEFEQAWRERDAIFLPEGQTQGSGVQVIDKPTKFLYWRGMKVYELPKESQYTYNILDNVELTEDRTLAHVYYARSKLANYVAQVADAPTVAKIATVGEKYWEHGLEPDKHVAPSRTFHDFMLRHPKHVGGGFHGYYRAWDERVTIHTFDAFKAHPLPWKIDGNNIVDGNNVIILEAPYGYKGKWSLLAEQLLAKVNPVEVAEEPEDDRDDDDQGDDRGPEADADGAGEDHQ